MTKPRFEARWVAEKRLAEYFYQGGYVRVPNPKRQRRDTHEFYKKGYEIRFVAYSKAEASDIVRLLRICRLKPGRTHKKVNRIIVPVYGRKEMEQFLALLSSP